MTIFDVNDKLIVMSNQAPTGPQHAADTLLPQPEQPWVYIKKDLQRSTGELRAAS